MAEEKDLKMLDELKAASEEISQVQNEKDDPAAVLWKENPDEFSSGNISFLQVSSIIFEQTEDLFAVTRTCDRFSPLYLRLCSTLLKAIDHLGSIFLTKVALLAEKRPIDGLEGLTANRLYEMVCFNIRKCDAALTEIKNTRFDFDLNYYNLLLRFAAAAQRLRVTRDKANYIGLGIISAGKFRKGLEYFPASEQKTGETSKNKQTSPFRSKAAYPLRYDALEEAKANSAEAPESYPIVPADEGSGDDELLIENNDEVVSGYGAEEYYGIPPMPEITEKVKSYEELTPEERDRLPHIPKYIEILWNAKKRGREAGDGSYSFYPDEIEFLLSDPDFCRTHKDMARSLRELTDQPDSS